jgi:hypothetical protein
MLIFVLVENIHFFLKQADGLAPVVEDPGRAIATVQKGSLGLGQEDSDAGFADRTLSSPNLAKCGFENEFFR